MPGVDHLQFDRDRRVDVTPTSTPPERVYLIALETRFWTSRRSRLRSVFTTSDEGTTRRRSFFARAIGVKSVADLLQQTVETEGRSDCGFIAPASRREMSSTAPRMFSTDSSEESILPTQLAVGAVAEPLHQRGGVEPRRVERLQDVVAGAPPGSASCRDWLPRPGACALRQLALTRVSSAVRSATRCSSVSLARLRPCRPRTRAGDVGIGRDDAAVGHRVGADLDDAAAGPDLDLPGFAECGQPLDRSRRLDRPVRYRRARPDGAGSRSSEMPTWPNSVGQVEKLPELPVPAGQPQVLCRRR